MRKNISEIPGVGGLIGIVEFPLTRVILGAVLAEAGMAHENSPFSMPLRIIGYLMILSAFVPTKFSVGHSNDV